MSVLSRIELKSHAEIERMRVAGSLLREVMAEVTARVCPHVTTAELDHLARKLIRDGGGRPAFLGYRGYPATLCTSINEEVVHGIPSARELLEGDIVAIDCGLILQGYYADMAVTQGVGTISDEAMKLLEVTRLSLEVGIAQMQPGNRLGDLSSAIQTSAESHGLSVVREYTGHGIGRELHEPPQVPNVGEAGKGPRMKPGLVLAIEPMINIGTWKTRVLDDNWTVVTADGSLSAHFEHTIAVTPDGPLVLTA